MPNTVAYGFMNLQDRFNELVDNVGIRVVEDAINATATEHARVLDAMLRLFVRQTTEYQLRYRTPGGLARLQPLDENGRARPIKDVGHYDVAWPLYTAGAAWGATWMARVKMTVEDANRQTTRLFTADRIWMRDKIFAAIFQNATWQVTDEDHGELTIQPLANGDATAYPYWSGASFGAADNHFMAQAAAIADGANPFPNIVTELKEHPDNDGEVVVFVPTNLVTSITGLATFVDVPDSNLIPANTAARLANGGPALGDIPGTLLGYETSKAWIVEWPTLPNNYMIAITTGGERALAMREDENEALRGFRPIATREDHPFWEQQWFRRAGFGAWNRTGAVIIRIGNAAYAPPADYALPAL